MFSKYFRDLLMGLKSSITASLISIIGLSVSIAVFIFIMLYVSTELRINRSFPEYNNIYRISSGDGTGFQGTPARLGEILTDNLPEVISFTRVNPGGTNHVLKIDNVPMRTGKLIYADSSFFRLFALPFKYGDPLTCLSDKYDVVITESLSDRLFGKASPVGKVVKLDGKFDVRITGVIYDPGQSTNIDGDLFISFHSMPEIKNWPDLYDCYTCYNYQTYLLLAGNADPDISTQKINDALVSYGKMNSIPSLIDHEYSLTDMHDVYFGPEERPDFRKGNSQQLSMLSLTALLILIIAIINYVNLSTAQASSRLRQLAIRKVMGASRKMLISSIIGEAIIISMLSLLAGLLIMKLASPLFVRIMNIDFNIALYSDPIIFLIFILAGAIIGFLAGLYPALSVTGFSTANSLSANINDSLSGGRVRKVLTALQVFVSIVLIGSTIIIYKQLSYINNYDLGFDKEVLVYLPLNDEILNRKQAFREELLAHNGIDNVSYSYSSYRTSNERWTFEFNDNEAALHIENVDEYYLNTLGLELFSGRDFRGRQDSLTIIVNQEACKQYFGDNPEGTIIESLGGMEIIGVVRDFRFLTFDREVEPIGLKYRPDRVSLCNIRLSGGEFTPALEHMEKTWNDFCLNYPFECHFVDKLYEDRYIKYRSAGRLLVLLSLITVVIAGLGIFGLASYTVSKRSKEVGIRKTNGASIPEIIMVLTGDINRIVLWCIIPASLLIYFIMSRWLNGFAYHISLPFFVFPLSVFSVWSIALISTIGKTIVLARINPVDVLRRD